MGMFVALTFPVVRKSPYGFLFGPSDLRGRIEVSRDQILSQAKKAVDLFPMDHWSLELDWTGVLRVTPVNREGLAGALHAFRLYRGNYDHGPGYEESLKVADAILARRGEAEMTATVRFEAKEPVTIETVRATAA
jgi:hypothetical protein